MTTKNDQGLLFDTVSSTQDALKEWAKGNTNIPHYFYAHALEQTQGRGRQGREWISEKGSLFLSVLLKEEELKAVPMTWIPIRAGLALNRTIAHFLGNEGSQNIKIKWPNDQVWVSGSASQGEIKKIAGIISEKIGNYFIVGVGVNIVTSPKVDRPTASLFDVSGKKIDLNEFRDLFLNELKDEFESPEFTKSYQQRFSEQQLFKVGQKIGWGESFLKETGAFFKIGTSGELIVKDAEGLECSLYSEDVHLI